MLVSLVIITGMRYLDFLSASSPSIDRLRDEPVSRKRPPRQIVTSSRPEPPSGTRRVPRFDTPRLPVPHASCTLRSHLGRDSARKVYRGCTRRFPSCRSHLPKRGALPAAAGREGCQTEPISYPRFGKFQAPMIKNVRSVYSPLGVS